jgi:predicted RND superfamily exporter protein
MGMAGYVMKRLNILTAMYMVALVGLGVDYAIHLMTTYMQEREDGKSFSESVQESMRKSGSGILTGALTTAIAFFALIVAESQVVKELGVIAGLGILCEFAAMFILVPALLGFRNHILIKRGRSGARLLHGIGLRYRFMYGLGDRIKHLPGLFAFIPLVLAVIFVLQAPKVEIEGNIMNMEAKGLESVELQDVMVEEFGTAPDVMSVLGSDLEELRSMEDQIEDLASVKRVDSLLPYYPSEEEQTARLPEVELFRLELRSNQVKPEVDMEALREEMIRLEYNLLEISDLAYVAGMEKMLDRLNRLTGLNEEGQKVTTTHLDRIISHLENDPIAAHQGLLDFQQTLVPMLSDTLFTMAGTENITQEMIPEFILDSYRSEDGTAYLLNIVPTRNPWEQEYRTVLTDQLATVTDRATGMVLAADQMTQIARTDGVRAAVVALITIFFLLLIDFRNVKLSILTLLPLILSMASLLGIMAVAGIKFDFINVIAIPLLIGIGIDDAVHISHRYVLEGKGRIDRVVAKTGAAVLLTSLTTIIGFASFIPSIMRAMRSTGIVLSIAMALAFLFSILFFPSVLLIVVEKLNWNIYPWKRSKK